MKKEVIIKLISFIAYYTGIVEILLRKQSKKRYAYVVMGHRLAKQDPFFFGGCDPIEFDKAIETLKKHFDFIQLETLYQHIQEKKPLSKSSIVLTFDDGFRDNYSNGMPIFKKHNISAMIYLVHNSIEQQMLPWSQRLGYSLKNTKIKNIAFRFKEFHFQSALSSERNRLLAFNKLSKFFQVSSFGDRENMICQIENQLKVDPPKDMMLTWGMISEMKDYGLEFGAHTLSHPLLGNIDITEAKQEIIQSKKLIEQKIGFAIDHFAFPAGSMNNTLRNFLREEGFKTSFIKKNLKKLCFENDHNTLPHEIRRIGLHNAQHYVIIAEFAGVFNVFRRIIHFR